VKRFIAGLLIGGIVLGPLAVAFAPAASASCASCHGGI